MYKLIMRGPLNRGPLKIPTIYTRCHRSPAPSGAALRRFPTGFGRPGEIMLKMEMHKIRKEKEADGGKDEEDEQE